MIQRKSIVLVALATLFMFQAVGISQETKRFAIVIHGGAGRAPSDPTAQAGRLEDLSRALDLGTTMLADGRSSLDTVEAVVRLLEDSPWFNAGRGAVFNADGRHEHDATIMDGATRAAGAVGGISTVKNPISLARLVMEETPHVLLVAGGAEKFADEMSGHPKIERVANEYFSTELRRRQWAQSHSNATPSEPAVDDSTGTVGCVALDSDGNLAAATSTGGLTGKKFGRLGDSPIVGAGTYASNDTCGVSCTGIGEDFIRHVVAYDVAARMEHRGQSLVEAAEAVLHHPERKVRGGLIAVSHTGEIVMKFNTASMTRAATDSSGRREVYGE